MDEELLWVVIRQDDNGNRYRVGRYPSREEAQRVADGFAAHGHGRLYVIEKIDRRQVS